MSQSQKYTIDFTTASESDLQDIIIPLTFDMQQTGHVHGLAFWFEVAFIGSQFVLVAFRSIYIGIVVLVSTVFRMTTCLENLEMSGNLTAVREMSGILLKVKRNVGSVREKILSRKSGLKLFIVSCIFASIHDFAELVHFILVLDDAMLHSCSHH